MLHCLYHLFNLSIADVDKQRTNKLKTIVTVFISDTINFIERNVVDINQWFSTLSSDV